MLRNFCFTLNNYSEDEFQELLELPEGFKYLVMGKEVGKEGTPHLQGYVQLKSSMRFGTLKKRFPRMHVEQAKGTWENNYSYCTKDGDFYEVGERKCQGARTDLEGIRKIAAEEGMRGVTLKAKNLQGVNLAKSFLTYHEEPRDWECDVTWIVGPSGIGKSRTAREICSGDVYTKNCGSKWWDGYDAHEEVIIDDFRDSWWSITEMLSLLDRYEKRVEIKGGWRQFKPHKIVITSIWHPDLCYRSTGECIAQLRRRIKTVIDLTPKKEAYPVSC